LLTTTASLVATGNSDADTLIAGGGADTLVAGSGAASLVGGSGNDTFVVNNAADVVTDTSTTTTNTIEASVSYTLPTNVQYLDLSGTAALTATGNSATNLITGNSGNDTLSGGAGLSVLEGGRTSGQDVIQAMGNQAALVAGAGSSTLTGGAYADFYASGATADSITTGATSNVVAVNMGDGATTLTPTSGATNILSLGGGIDTEALSFSKSGNNLILTDGDGGDGITFSNWYADAGNQDYSSLQVIEAASSEYNPSGGDPLRNEGVEVFDLSTLVAEFDAAGDPSNWALSNGMASAQLTGSNSAAYGGDLAYYYGLDGNVTGMNLSAAASTLTNASYATSMQSVDSWGSISGGGGATLQLEVARRPGTGATSATTEVSSSSDGSGNFSAVPHNLTPVSPSTSPTWNTVPTTGISSGEMAASTSMGELTGAYKIGEDWQTRAVANIPLADLRVTGWTAEARLQTAVAPASNWEDVRASGPTEVLPWERVATYSQWRSMHATLNDNDGSNAGGAELELAERGDFQLRSPALLAGSSRQSHILDAREAVHRISAV
jgi:hypothetical protein